MGALADDDDDDDKNDEVFFWKCLFIIQLAFKGVLVSTGENLE